MSEQEKGEKQNAEDQIAKDQKQDLGAADQDGKGKDQKGEDGKPQTIEITTDVLRALRGEIKSLKDQNLLYKGQLEAQTHLSVNPPLMPNPSRVAGGVEIPNTGSEGEVKFDIDDETVITGADLKKILKSLPKGEGKTQVDPIVAEKLAVLELHIQDPNWQQTIKTYLPEMINTNPMIVQQIRGAANPLQAALLFARMNPKFAATQQGADGKGGDKENGEDDDLMTQIDKIIENAEKPGGGHNAGAASGLNVADKYAAMSEEEFDTHVDKVLQGTVS